MNVLKKKYLVLTAVLCLSAMVFAGCGNNKDDNGASASPDAQETMAPEETDDAMRDGEDALDDTGDAAKDALDDAGDAARDAVDGAGDAVRDAGDAAGDVLNDATDDTDGALDQGEKDNATDTNNSETSGKNR